MKRIFILFLFYTFVLLSNVTNIYSKDVENDESKFDNNLILHKQGNVLEYGEKINFKDYFYDEKSEIVKTNYNSKKTGKQAVEIIFAKDKTNYKIKRVFEVIDTRAPIIEFKKEKVEVIVGENYSLKNNILNCFDEIDGNLTPNVKGDFDKNKLGTYTIEVSAVDINNNTTKKEFQIEVVKDRRVKFSINTNAMPSLQMTTTNKIALKILDNFKKGVNKTTFTNPDGNMYEGTKIFSDTYLGKEAWANITFLVTKQDGVITVEIIEFDEAKKYYKKRQDSFSSYKSQVYNALNKMNLYTTPEDMAQQINDYIVKNFSYKLINVIDVKYFMNTKQGKCWHYAMLFRDMCRAVGLNVSYMEGYAYGEYHAWNSIIIDGEKYYFDTTLNDTLKTNRFSLATKNTLSKTHSW